MEAVIEHESRRSIMDRRLTRPLLMATGIFIILAFGLCNRFLVRQAPTTAVNPPEAHAAVTP
jgi:hypothetical protein